MHKELRYWIIAKQRYYAEKLGLDPCPDIALDYIKMDERNTLFTEGKNKMRLEAGAGSDVNFTFLVMENIEDMDTLEESIVHELIHIKYPRKHHSNQFDNLVKALIDRARTDSKYDLLQRELKKAPGHIA